jgi:hypothetical protein
MLALIFYSSLLLSCKASHAATLLTYETFLSKSKKSPK